MANKIAKKWSELFDAIPDFVSLHDADYRFVRVNKALADFLGKKPEDVTGEFCYKALHNTDKPIPNCPHTKAMQTKQPVTGEINDPHIGCPLLVSVTPIFDEQGKLLGSIHVAKDISEYKRTQETFRRTAQLQDTLNAILRLSLTSHSLEKILNNALAHIVAIPRLALQSRGAIFLLEDESNNLVMKSSLNLPQELKAVCAQVPFGQCICGRAAKSKKLQFMASVDKRHRCFEKIFPHGHYCAPLVSLGKALGVLNLYVSAGHVRNKEDEKFMLAIANVLAGIIERKQAEETALSSERELTIRNQLSEIFLTVSNENMYSEVLKVVLDVMKSRFGTFGYIDEDGSVVYPSMTKDIWDKCQIPDKTFIFPRQIWGGIWGRTLIEKQALYSSGPFKVPEGHVPITRALAVPLLFHGELVGHFNIANKETDYDDADQKTLEGIADYIAPLLYSRLQRERQEKKRKQAEQELRNYKQHLEKLVEERTAELKTRQGEIEELNKNLAIRVKEEVEKSRQKDFIMIQHARMAAMGQMIGNIAHQWRQPLNALNLVLFNTKEAFYDEVKDKKKLDEFVEIGNKLISKMSTTIDDFRNFFTPVKEKSKFSINKVVKDSLSLVEASLKYHNISVTIKDEAEVSILGFPSEYSQVVLNILNNAKDAILDNGVKGRIKIGIYCEDNNAMVKIRNNGGSIPEDIVDKIFDPYFTTKEIGKGTGIGLYMAKIIIEEHSKGKIQLRNFKGGAEFKICTPICYQL